MTYPLFHIPNIEKALVDFAADFDTINDRLSLHRENLTPAMIANLLEAYAFLNHLLRKDVDLFSLAGLHSLLELNHIVLCGTDRRTRFEYHSHILETRKTFHAGIRSLRKWVLQQRSANNPFKLAAGFYAIALSQPQLFIEGNHRTENIVLNYLLVSAGQFPFVIDPHHAFHYLELSSRIKFADKKNIMKGKWSIPGLRKEFVTFLQSSVHPGYISKQEAT